jgi:hypothetical protein
MNARFAPLLASVALLAVPGAADALELDSFTEKLQLAVETGDTEIEFGEARIEGEAVVLSDVTFTPADGEAVRFETVTFDGVEETPGGGYLVEEVRVPDVDYTEDGIRFQVEDITVSGLDIPADPGATPTLDDMVLYEQARSGPITVSRGGTEVFRLSELVVDVARRPDDSGIDTMVRANDIFIDLTTVEDPKARAAIETMGYEQITGSMMLNAGWTVETGEIDLADFTMTFDEVGSFIIALNISGYTLEFIESVQETEAAAESGGSEEATGMAMLGLMQQLTFNSASVRFEDDGLTGRMLDYAGEQQGVAGEQMALAVKGMLPLFLGQIEDEAFREELREAVSTFLDDPQSLTISAEPESPVPFVMLMGAGFTDPQSLTDMLGLEVWANR